MPGALTVEADYHQIHLLDDGRPADLGEAWTVKATEDRLAVAEGMIGVGTEADGPVRVTVERRRKEPAARLDPWDHVTECSLELRSGRLVVVGCTEYLPDARRLVLEAGPWRLRIQHKHLARPSRQAITILLWPAPMAGARVLKRWTPPPPAPVPRPQRAPRTAKAAAAEARRGRLEVAVPVLARLADAGDAAASASLAEIHAFRGEWAAFVPRAEALLASPGAVNAGNVFTDLTRVFRRAARELGAPELVERAAARVPTGRFQAMRDATLLRDVVLPSERVTPGGEAERTAYAEGVRAAVQGKRFADRPLELARHLFAMAGLLRIEDEVLRLWQEQRSQLGFDAAVQAARWLVQKGRADEAWDAVRSKLPRWWPADHAQVAPLILLVDPSLAPLMTPARCAEVLATPRGPEAA